jgi:hypothetical protein
MASAGMDRIAFESYRLYSKIRIRAGFYNDLQ